MAEKTIIIIAICSVYYILGGLATTNILRLTAGNTLPVRSSKCFCDSCGSKITSFLQLPIISYIVCKGKCRNCSAKIPVYPLVLEIVIWGGMSAVSAVFQFSVPGVICSFLFYEIVRIVFVVKKGKRENNFAKEYVIAVLSMLKFLIAVVIFSVIGNML